MTFLNDEIRRAFHELPLDRQREFVEMSAHLRLREQDLKILYVELSSDGTAEISLSIFPIRTSPLEAS